MAYGRGRPRKGEEREKRSEVRIHAPITPELLEEFSEIVKNEFGSTPAAYAGVLIADFVRKRKQKAR